MDKVQPSTMCHVFRFRNDSHHDYSCRISVHIYPGIKIWFTFTVGFLG